MEVKIGDDVIFIEKKFVKLGAAALEKPEEVQPDKVEKLEEEGFATQDDRDITASIEEPIEPVKPSSDLEMLRAKLKKSLAELEEIRSSMSTSYTSTNTISGTITSLRGMLDALKKDQMDILSRR